MLTAGCYLLSDLNRKLYVNPGVSAPMDNGIAQHFRITFLSPEELSVAPAVPPLLMSGLQCP